MIGMKYGISGITTLFCRSFTTERTHNRISFFHEKELRHFFSDSVANLGFEIEDVTSGGIQAVLGGSGNIEQVQATYSETANIDNLKIARFPGSDLPDEDRLIKTYATGVRYLGEEITFQVSGRGEQVIDETDQGSAISVTFQSTDGTFSLATPSGAKVETVSLSETNDGEPWKWQANFFGYITNTSVGSNMISLPAEISALLPSNSIHTTNLSYTMVGDRAQNVKTTYQIANHLTT